MNLFCYPKAFEYRSLSNIIRSILKALQINTLTMNEFVFTAFFPFS